MSRIDLDAGNGADDYTLRGLEMPYAFSAERRFNFVNFLTLINSIIRTFWLADVTIYTFTSNTKSHQ